MKWLLLFMLSLTGLSSNICLGQTQNNVIVPTIPKPSLLPPSGGSFGTTPSRSQPQQSKSQQQLQQHQQRVNQEQEKQKQLDQMLREDKLEAKKRVAEMKRNSVPRIQYDFPSKFNLAGTGAYRKAFIELLSLKPNFSISKAVFTAENAYFNNVHPYEFLEEGLKQTTSYLKNKMAKEGQDTSNNVALNLMIYRFFADTMTYDDGNLHLPFSYDFEDYTGREDFTKTMVYKLLGEHSGQCHSLPLLYLMIAEYMGAEAYLVNAPMHTYIKFPLPNGGFQNIELTNNFFNTDAHVIVSGYVKAEALQSKLYMQPLSEKQLLSDNIADLAKGYTFKFGPDPFVMQMIDSALLFDSTNIVALLLKSNYLTYQFRNVEQQLGVTANNFQAVLSHFPKAAAILKARNATYDKIDELGYEPMPDEAYQSWLMDMKDEINEQENAERFIQLKKVSE